MVTVKRVVANIGAPSLEGLSAFYRQLFDLDVVMDHGWIVTLASDERARVQLSLATEGGSGTPVPDLSIEVDDVETVYEQAKALHYDITYPLTDEPWGVRRFFLKDPAGKLLNVLSHQS
jgi:predicted enzyme related to lactoylglutathione lyase